MTEAQKEQNEQNEQNEQEEQAAEIKPVKRIANLEAKKRWGLRVHWLCYIALLILISWVNLSQDDGSLSFWFIQTIPLLLPLVGMLKGSHKAYSWLCFIILYYFTTAVVNVGMPSEMVKLHHWLQLFLSISLFFTAMFSSRWLQYWNYWQQQKEA